MQYSKSIITAIVLLAGGSSAFGDTKNIVIGTSNDKIRFLNFRTSEHDRAYAGAQVFNFHESAKLKDFTLRDKTFYWGLVLGYSMNTPNSPYVNLEGSYGLGKINVDVISTPAIIKQEIEEKIESVVSDSKPSETVSALKKMSIKHKLNRGHRVTGKVALGYNFATSYPVVLTPYAFAEGWYSTQTGSNPVSLMVDELRKNVIFGGIGMKLNWMVAPGFSVGGIVENTRILYAKDSLKIDNVVTNSSTERNNMGIRFALPMVYQSEYEETGFSFQLEPSFMVPSLNKATSNRYLSSLKATLGFAF